MSTAILLRQNVSGLASEPSANLGITPHPATAQLVRRSAALHDGGI